jgi:hypothetical protein
VRVCTEIDWVRTEPGGEVEHCNGLPPYINAENFLTR